jgi:heme/copper-type cytochrome/quinol oxidase subunit 2
MTVKFAGYDEMKSIAISGEVLSAEDYDKWVVENEAKKKAETPTPAVAKPVKNSKTAKPVKNNG